MGSTRDMKPDQEMPDELSEVFAAYRAACPDPEPGAGFMPGLWARIESRRRSSQLFGLFARRLLAGAAALTLVMAALLYHPGSHFGQHSTYLDVLADDHQELAELDLQGPGAPR